MTYVLNEAGEAVSERMHSDAEACRWFLTNGRRGDYLDDTGEYMSQVVREVFAMEVFFDSLGCPVVDVTTDTLSSDTEPYEQR